MWQCQFRLECVQVTVLSPRLTSFSLLKKMIKENVWTLKSNALSFFSLWCILRNSWSTGYDLPHTIPRLVHSLFGTSEQWMEFHRFCWTLVVFSVVICYSCSTSTNCWCNNCCFSEKEPFLLLLFDVFEWEAKFHHQPHYTLTIPYATEAEPVLVSCRI